MVKRAKFSSEVDIKQEDYDKFLDHTIVKDKLKTGNPMVDLQIEKVFAFSRIKRPITWFHFVFFICWTPIGIPILLIRVVVMLSFLGFFHSISSVPGLKNLRAYVPYLFVTCIMPICGLFHSIHGADNKAAVHVDKTIFVCNHISNFDPLWFNCVFKEFTLLCAGDYDWFWEMMKRIGILSQDDEKGKGCIYTSYFGTAQEREEVRIAIEEDMARDDARPFLIYPEGCVTTGVCAVMQYQKFVFGLDKVIVPLCLSVYNPWPYEHYTLSAGASTHLMWYMFSPFIIMRHALLEPQKRRPNEKPQDFALRVQCMTAAHLGLSVIKMNWKQKDRLSQALGFMPYNAHEWSRRESLDTFREALFKRQVIIRDGHAVNKNDITPDGKTEEDGVFLAKEYAYRKSQESDEEMQIFGEAMKLAQSKKKRERSVRHNVKKNQIIPEANETMVNKVNEARRKSSVTSGEAPDLLKMHNNDVVLRQESIKKARRKSSLMATEADMIKLAGGESELTPQALEAIHIAAEFNKAELAKIEAAEKMAKEEAENKKNENETREKDEKEWAGKEAK